MNENIYVYGDIRIKGFEELTLSDLSIIQEINQHGELNVKAMVPEEVQESYLKSLYIGKGIAVLLKGKQIFSGIITELTISYEAELCHVNLTALTYTCLSDIEKKKRSFQDQNMSYSAVLSDVVSAYHCTSFIGHSAEEMPIGYPLIQYQETDWEFMKRIASRFHLPLIVYGRDPAFKFYLGFSQPARNRLTAKNYKVKKEFVNVQEESSPPGGKSPSLWSADGSGKSPSLRSADGSGKSPSLRSADGSGKSPSLWSADGSGRWRVAEQDSIYYEVITDEYFDLGDGIVFQGKEMHLSKSVFEYKRAVIQNTCTLSFADGCDIPRISNAKIAGCSLFGRVLATARDCVKIHLDIDRTQDPDTAFWFPYATMYASQQETGWYCMPEIGDTVRLYVPEQEEFGAMAINSIKPHDPEAAVEGLDAGHPMANPDVKYIRTTYGKEIKFRPDGMDIIAKDGTVFMTLNDDGTMYLNSNGKISMTAMNQIEMKAQVINFEALHSIRMKGKSSSIMLDEEITMKGNEIKNN